MIDVSHQDVCSLSVRLPYLYQSMSFSYLTAYSGIGGKTILTASSGVAPRWTASRAAASSASYGYGPSFEKEL